MECVGRFDFSKQDKPKVWAPGAYIHFKFKGTSCLLTVWDEVRFYSQHNYLLISVDGKTKRMQLKEVENVLVLAKDLENTEHEVFVYKETEAGIGYIQFGAISCEKLLPIEKKENYDVEFIGDSITAGNGADTTLVKCKTGVWYDQHSAYNSYGMRISRKLKLKTSISAISGIGVSRSCCGTEHVISDAYEFYDFQPDGIPYSGTSETKLLVVTLGQNDGLQDSTIYKNAYISFLKRLHKLHPKAKVLLCSSPMGNKELKEYQRNVLPQIAAKMNVLYPEKYSDFHYKGTYNSGCDKHPTILEHEKIQQEIESKIKELLDL